MGRSRYGIIGPDDPSISYFSGVYSSFHRFIKEHIDSLQPDKHNRYIYCYNNPVNLIDPLGLSPEEEVAEGLKIDAEQEKQGEIKEETVGQPAATGTEQKGQTADDVKEQKGSWISRYFNQIYDINKKAVKEGYNSIKSDPLKAAEQLLPWNLVKNAVLRPIHQGKDLGKAITDIVKDPSSPEAWGRATDRVVKIGAEITGLTKLAFSKKTVRHYTDDIGRGGISKSGFLDADTFVTKPSGIPKGMTPAQIERILEINPGRGAHYIDMKVRTSNLAIPDNGAFTSGGAWQRQLIKPESIDPTKFQP